MTSILLLSIGVVVVAALLIALPEGQGCLIRLVRTLGLIIGAVVPIVLIYNTLNALAAWQSIVALVVMFILNVCVVSLAALGWQAALHRNEGLAEAAESALFNPFDFLSSSGSSSSNGLDDLLFFIGLLILLGLLVVGVLLAGLFEHYLLPNPTSPGRRFARVALCLVYALALHVGLMVLLYQWGNSFIREFAPGVNSG